MGALELTATEDWTIDLEAAWLAAELWLDAAEVDRIVEAATEALEAFEVTMALAEATWVEALELVAGFQPTFAPPKGLAHPGVNFWVDVGAVLTAYLARKSWTSVHRQPVIGCRP